MDTCLTRLNLLVTPDDFDHEKLLKKLSFALRITSVNVTKSAGLKKPLKESFAFWAVKIMLMIYRIVYSW